MWRSRGGRNSWKDWLPEEDMEGTVSLIYTDMDSLIRNIDIGCSYLPWTKVEKLENLPPSTRYFEILSTTKILAENFVFTYKFSMLEIIFKY